MIATSVSSRAGTPITLNTSVAGPVDFIGTGASLRATSNTVNACNVVGTASATLTGLPATATVRQALLYWAGSYSAASGSTQTAPDYDVFFTGSAVTADRQYTETFSFGGTDYDFFSGVADVTAIVALQRNGTYELSGLDVNTAGPHCGVQAVVAGWTLVVFYEDPAEPTRVINLYEGFRFYRGGSIVLSPSNFRIPTAPIDGRHSHISWEGDESNSGTLNGFTEQLTFQGYTLTDAVNPQSNQFNSTVNVTAPADTQSWGTDFDSYDISPYLSPGMTQVQTEFSSGADLVLLSAELIAVTNTAVADLTLNKSHSGDFQAGQPGQYTLTVANQGPDNDPGPFDVSDTLPPGLTLVGYGGPGWSCSAAAQVVNCTHPGPLPAGTQLPGLQLTVLPDVSAPGSLTNTANVNGTQFDNQPANNTASDPTTILKSDLSTSTKQVLDLNGGNVEAGDILRYTVTLIETGGLTASSVRVTDDLAASFGALNIRTQPPGSVDTSNPSGGTHGSGFVDIGNITVGANATAQVVFEVEIEPATPAGTLLNNSALIENSSGLGAFPSASELTVAASPPGNKPVYLHTVPGLELTRLPASSSEPHQIIDRTETASWTLTPSIQRALVIDGAAGAIPVRLWLRKGGTSASRARRRIRVELSSSGTTTTAIGSITRTVRPTGTPTEFTFNIPISGDIALAQGSFLVLDVTNVTGGQNNRRVRLFPATTGGTSRAELVVHTVIAVDAVDVLDASWPGGSPVTWAGPGQRVWVRAVVGDPFGAYDISAATVEMIDSSGSAAVSAAPMNLVADSAADTRTYEYLFDIPGGGPSGLWTARVTAAEGTEGLVFDTAAATWAVIVPPQLTLLKSASVTTAAPGDPVTYTLQVTNTTTEPAADVHIEDQLGRYSAFSIDAFGSGQPFQFIQGTPPSGLTFGSPRYSDDGGVTFNYTPVSGGGGAPAGHDANVTHWRIPLQGTMSGSGSSFTIRYRTEVR